MAFSLAADNLADSELAIVHPASWRGTTGVEDVLADSATNRKPAKRTVRRRRGFIANMRVS
jgi:hypothetical protein